MNRTIERWGWVDRDGPQEEVFRSADEAIAEMQQRMGAQLSIERLHELGFDLALLNIEISAKAVLTPNDRVVRPAEGRSEPTPGSASGNYEERTSNERD